MLESLFFFVIAGITLLSALLAVVSHKIVYSSISVIITFFSVAGIFFLLNADFLGVSQIIIYSTGIAILILFAIMLTDQGKEMKLWFDLSLKTILSFVIASSFLFIVLISIFNVLKYFGYSSQSFNHVLPVASAAASIKTGGSAIVIGKQLLTVYLLPFEAVSILLLAAIVGCIAVAKKSKVKGDQA